jgi:hypothetical protein
MTTIKELEKVDRKIMEQEHFNSYRRPTILVSIVFLLFGICATACFCAVVWAVSYGIISLVKLIF